MEFGRWKRIVFIQITIMANAAKMALLFGVNWNAAVICSHRHVSFRGHFRDVPRNHWMRWLFSVALLVIMLLNTLLTLHASRELSLIIPLVFSESTISMTFQAVLYGARDECTQRWWKRWLATEAAKAGRRHRNEVADGCSKQLEGTQLLTLCRICFPTSQTALAASPVKHFF